MSRKKPFPTLHLVLFLMTCFTTLGAGSLHAGVDPFNDPAGLIKGLPFSATLMLILLSHEFAHYYSSIYHRTDATLPYFIPAPSFIGTFGAFIKMRSPIITRRALVDIGASGPIVGFVVSVVAVVAGLAWSKVSAAAPPSGALELGDSLLFSGLAQLILGSVPEGHEVFLHPVAFAGWIGFFVTSLNLIPIGQLDGGHITYALFGHRHRPVSMVLVAVLLYFGMVSWPGWGIWAFLMIIMGIHHPPVMYWETPLDPVRRRIGLASLIIFVLTFTPAPFSITP